MGERFSRAEQLEHRVQMLLGIFSAKGVLPLEFKPAHSLGDLLTQHLDELEQEAERKGGVIQLLIDHFAMVHKIDPPLAA
jgi:mannose/fructose-specific phosphotransferase system component IIA